MAKCGFDKLRPSLGEDHFVDDDKVILTQGRPKFVDTLRGNTEGEKLTWFSRDDRLLVNGVEAQPVKSVLLRKNK